MMTSTSNRYVSNTDETTRMMEAGRSHRIATFTVLEYPSLAGNCWDDELLPSGD